MPSYKSPTDAQLTAFLRVCASYDTLAKAAEEFGIAETSARRWRRLAKDRNLTGKELTAEAKLRIELAAAKRDLKAAQKGQSDAEYVARRVTELASRPPKSLTWLAPKRPPVGSRGVPMTIWSDWHYGEVVRPEEVGGVNSFNADVAAARIEELVNVTIDLCTNHMGRAETKYPGMVVCLGGDMITGNIHDELTITNDRTLNEQIDGLTDLLTTALEAMADRFGRLYIPCVVGNHGRSTHRPSMKQATRTSYEWNIYKNLARHFRKDPRFQFDIPDETDVYFKVYNHRFLLTHGDRLGVKGGDGIIGPLGPITRGVIKVRNSELQIGRDIDPVIMGHWHTLIWNDAYIVNGALKGYDEYARLAMRAPYSRPSQALWFVHPTHGMTAHWPIYLDKGPRESEETAEWIGWRTEP